MTPADIQLPVVIQDAWPQFSELLTGVQFHSNNPFWVVRPHFPDPWVCQDITSPEDIIQHVQLKKGLSGPLNWVRINLASHQRNRMAYRYSLNEALTDDGRAKNSRALPHITKLYESLRWPLNMGLIFPEGVEVILPQFKRLWVHTPLSWENKLSKNWRRYDHFNYIEYVRIR